MATCKLIYDNRVDVVEERPALATASGVDHRNSSWRDSGRVSLAMRPLWPQGSAEASGIFPYAYRCPDGAGAAALFFGNTQCSDPVEVDNLSEALRTRTLSDWLMAVHEREGLLSVEVLGVTVWDYFDELDSLMKWARQND